MTPDLVQNLVKFLAAIGAGFVLVPVASPFHRANQ